MAKRYVIVHSRLNPDVHFYLNLHLCKGQSVRMKQGSVR